jgi:hypothetical protein
MLVPNFWSFRSIVWFLLVPSVWFLLFFPSVRFFACSIAWLFLSKCLVHAYFRVWLLACSLVHCLFHFLVHACSKYLVLSFHCLVLTCSKCLDLAFFSSPKCLVHACFRVWLLACSPNVRFMFGSFPVQILYLIISLVGSCFFSYLQFGFFLIALFTLDGSSFFSCSKYHVDFFVLNLHVALSVSKWYSLDVVLIISGFQALGILYHNCFWIYLMMIFQIIMTFFD